MSDTAETLQKHHDFIICGAGPAGCVAAARLAQRGGVRILLLEAGPLVRSAATGMAGLWAIVGSERDWRFRSQPEPALADCAIGYSMGPTDD